MKYNSITLSLPYYFFFRLESGYLRSIGAISIAHALAVNTSITSVNLGIIPQQTNKNSIDNAINPTDIHL